MSIILPLKLYEILLVIHLAEVGTIAVTCQLVSWCTQSHVAGLNLILELNAERNAQIKKKQLFDIIHRLCVLRWALISQQSHKHRNNKITEAPRKARVLSEFPQCMVAGHRHQGECIRT